MRLVELLTIISPEPFSITFCSLFIGFIFSRCRTNGWHAASCHGHGNSFLGNWPMSTN